MLEVLRELLYQDPSRELFAALSAHVDANVSSPDLTVALAYCRSHVESWPDPGVRRYRPSSEELMRWLDKGRPPALLPLVRHLDLSARGLSRWDLKVVLPFVHNAHLESLDLAGNALEDVGVRALAMSRHLSHLTSLDLSVNGIGPEGVEALVDSEHLSALRALDLSGNAFGDEGVEVLCRGEGLPGLRTLGLSANALGRESAVVMARSVLLPRLRELHLGKYSFGLEGLELLGQTTALSELEVLGLEGSALGDEGLGVLVEMAARGLLSVRGLDLRQNGITADGAALLASSFESLESLALDTNPIGDAGVRALVGRATFGGALRRLSLSQAMVGNAGVEAIASAEQLGALEELELGTCNYDDKESLVYIGRSPSHRRPSMQRYWPDATTVLELGNGVGNRGARALAEAKHLGALRRLDLRNNKVGRNGAEALVFSAQLVGLRELDLAGNPVGDFDVAGLLADESRRRVEAAPSAAEGLHAIRRELGECTRCALCNSRGTIVFGAGDPRARVVFVGEAPRGAEDEKGEPFRGESGVVLDRVFAALGIDRSEVYLTNVAKCRPPESRKPTPNELATCLPFFWSQVGCLEPDLIVTFGRAAMQAVLGNASPLGALRGHLHEKNGFRVLPTWHPAYVLREPEREEVLVKDLERAAELVRRAR